MASVGYLSPVGKRLLAHRGLALDHHENSIAAFRAALAAGATHLETDVQLTRDGVPVLWHDKDVNRSLGTRVKVSELDWSQLRQLGLAAGLRVARLEDALEQLSDARFNIDLKTEAALGPAIAAIRAADARDRVLLTSFSDARRRRAAVALPGVATSIGSAALIRILSGSLYRGRGRSWRSSWRAALAGACAVQVPRSQYGIRVVTGSFIAAAHELGVEVHVWTINDPSEMRELWALGVDGIVTDRTDLAVHSLPR